MTVSELAQDMDMSEKALTQKIDGKSEWLFKEMAFITELFGFSEVRMAFPEIYNSFLEE